MILNDIACTGSEMNILNCTEDGYGSFTTCSHIAVAQCEGKLSYVANVIETHPPCIFSMYTTVTVCAGTWHLAFICKISTCDFGISKCVA